MIAEPRVLESKDIPALAEFLARVYRFDSSHRRVDHNLLVWKYLEPRPGWPGARSYVIEKEGRIIAHCGVCPVTFQLQAGTLINGVTMMDWAADAPSPGTGILLFRRLMEMAPVSFVIGGSQITRRILPRIGFTQVGEALTYSAWLRPWRELRARSFTGRSVLRLLHGMTHPVRRRGWSGDGWAYRQIRAFDKSLEPVLDHARRWTACKRTLADLNYLLKCPHLKTTGFLLLRQDRLAGYFVVARSTWEARVLDWLVDSDNASDWQAACYTMTSAIRRDSEACRIRAQSTIPALSQALAGNRYWYQYKEPLFLCDPSHALDQAMPAAFQLCDGDAGY